MSAETLKGQVEGVDRAALLSSARQTASIYFGTNCVDVRLSSVYVRDIEDIVSFLALFEAQENHELRTPTYGFPQCVGCKKTTSTAILPRAEWVDQK